MFRAQQNAFDDVVAKATDENLTSENWEYIMDVCDKVTTEDSGAKDAVASMIKRLAHRNANVQLYTLEPKLRSKDASRACIKSFHRCPATISQRSKFTPASESEDIGTDAGVGGNVQGPDLGIMRDQYQKLKSQNPNLHPPSAPSKSRLTEVDRQKEENELQMALKLSVQDKAAQAQAKSSQQQSSSSGPPQSQPAAQPQTVPSGTTAATVSRVRALFDFQATDPDELTFRKGDVIAVLESVYKDWWKGFLRGQTGIFPLNYVEKLADPTPDELQREAQMEAEVFAEIKNVEKLLTLLSTSTSDLNVRDNEEITKLYHSTLAIRPKLIELIGKYSQRKDDFTQLNERFIKSCRDYENLLDASMTQAQPAYQYGRQNQPPYGGGYPPQAAPPQSEPQRYYTPNPQDQPYPQQPSSPQGYPPQPHRTGPQPFYVVGQNQQHPQQPPSSSEPQGHQPYPQRDPTPRIPSASKPPPLQTTASPPPNQYPPHQAQSNQRPQSTYSNNPQELATSVYDSPVNQQGPYSASVYSEEEPYPTGAIGNQQPPPSQQQYNAYAPAPLNPQHPPPQPGYHPPAPPAGHIPPAGMNPGYPVIDSRQSLPSQGAPPPQGQYKAYQPPGSPDGTAPSAPSAPPGGPADFYRQSAAY
ncbi:Class E vacuolar protein-sorting machinery protein [Lachnellula occidentalis]|uniref:Class E vacuolar protein-sorting machinery protein HSE1 n=1 Tax=Lachnellula occidentalis TaxID=215460 RepID=A0A8H8UGY8_9HELO|nr:Class E vacuolar protein-sorting machinery protein [Lachnellula occidentalis]